MDDQRLSALVWARADQLTREAEQVRQVRQARQARRDRLVGEARRDPGDQRIRPARRRMFRWRRIWRSLVMAR